MKESNEIVRSFIEFLILNKKINFKFEDFTNTQNLVDIDVIEKSIEYPKLYQLNKLSDIFFKDFFEFSLNKLNSKFIPDYSKALKYVDDLDDFLNNEYNGKYLNQYHYLVDPFRLWLIKYLNNEVKLNIRKFLNNLPEEKKGRDKHLYSFERHYFEALPMLDIKVETIYKDIIRFFNENNYRHTVISFCIDLPNCNIEKGWRLYNYGVKNDLLKYSNLAGNLLLSLFKNEELNAYGYAISLFNDYPLTALFFFGRVKFNEAKKAKEIIDCIEKLDLDSLELLYACEYFYVNLIEQNINGELNQFSFKKFYEYFELGDKDICSQIIHSLSWRIKGFEDERFEFLLYVLKSVKKADILDGFFNNFKDPKNFFKLFYSSIQYSDFRANLKPFLNGFNHFINESFFETEKHLLQLISTQNKIIRTLVLKLMLEGNFRSIDLLKIDSEKEQLRAVEAILSFPYSFDTILPMLLNLRNSKYKKVVIEIQNGLSQLIIEAYHGHLLDWIKKDIGNSKKDKIFLKPIEDAYDYYCKIKDIKDANKHLDPLENERIFIDLYYSLEDELRAEMMDEIRNGDSSFLSEMTSSVIIVRGNSWKLEGKDEITPLGRIETSSVLDGRSFKNPDLFEANLNNPHSKF